MLSDKIEIFIEVAQNLCFSETAKKRFSSQPTISRQISALESEWGVKLFVRTNKGLRLTPEGSIMLECCIQIKNLCENSLKLAKDLSNNKKAQLHLGFLADMDVDQIFMPYLVEFSSQYKNVDITIELRSFRELREGLHTGHYDIIYTLGFETKYIKDEIVFNKMGELKAMFVLSKYHPLFKKVDLTILDCVNETFFLPEAEDAPGREEELRLILKAHGIKQGKIELLPDLESAIMQMKMGKGIALLDSGIKGIKDKTYRTISANRYKESIDVVSIWKKENLNPYVSMLVNNQIVNLIS